MKILTEAQMGMIQENIQTELLKRGFNAKIQSIEELESRAGKYVSLHTDSFQTVPVLFKSIQISEFGSSIRTEGHTNDDGKEYTQKHVWIQISARYEHFSGGSNGVNIFSCNFLFVDENPRPYEFNIGY